MTDAFSLFIDSRDAIIVGDNPADILLINALDQELANLHYSISVESAIIPSLEYPINSKNNTFTFLEFQSPGPSTSHTATLEQGNYTGFTLASEVASAMNSATPAPNLTYTCTYSSVSNKLRISTVSGIPDALAITSDNDTLGFVNNSTLSATVSSAYPVRLEGTNYYDVVASVRTRNLTSLGRRDVLSRIENPVNYGGIVFYDNRNDADSSQMSGGSLDRLEIQLYDDKNQIVEFPRNAHWSMTLRLSRLS